MNFKLHKVDDNGNWEVQRLSDPPDPNVKTPVLKKFTKRSATRIHDKEGDKVDFELIEDPNRLVYAQVNDCFTDYRNIQLCQSTGLTAIKGQTWISTAVVGDPEDPNSAETFQIFDNFKTFITQGYEDIEYIDAVDFRGTSVDMAQASLLCKTEDASGKRLRYNCFHHASSDKWYARESNVPREHPDSWYVTGYHSSPRPCYMLGSQNSKFRVGYEIEKNNYNGRTSIGTMVPNETNLFSGVETDSSCGIEMLTHVLPLELDREDVKELIMANEEVLGQPADHNCGGHVNMSSDDMSAASMVHALVPKMGIVYAMWRKRLKAGYCGGNNIGSLIRLQSQKQPNPRQSERHSPLRIKGGGVVECRIPNAVVSAEQLWKRHQFFAGVLHYRNLAWDDFLEAMEPLVAAFFTSRDGGVSSAKKRLKYARAFQTFIDTGYVDSDIAEFLTGSSGKGKYMNYEGRLVNKPLPAEAEGVVTSDTLVQVPSWR